MHRIDARTGELLSTTQTAALPDGVIYKACGNRRASTCPACAETYRRDAFQVIRSGLIGGKGIPPAVATHPAVFATFTAPSFGPVHTRPIRQHTCTEQGHLPVQPQPCHARRDAGTCPHGRPAGLLHPPSPRRPRAWASRSARTATTTTPPWFGTTTPVNCGGAPSKPSNDGLTRPPGTGGLPYGVRVSHGKAAEYQARGAVHFHALLRLDGLDPADPGKLLPPPPGITVADLEDATRRAAATIAYLTAPHPAQPTGWFIAWGDELDVRVITMRGTGTVTDLMVASYLAKYSTKGTEVTGHTSARITPDTIDLYADPHGTHTERLIYACWRLGAHPEFRSLQRWAHMLGFGGHFLTKARNYSVTFADLRAARITYRRSQDPGPEHQPIRTAEHAERGNHPHRRQPHLRRNRLENHRRRPPGQHRRRPSQKTPRSRKRRTRRRIQPHHHRPPGRITHPQPLTLKRQKLVR